METFGGNEWSERGIHNTVAKVPFEQLAVDERGVYLLGPIYGIYRLDKRGGRPREIGAN
jgi:hypothetical protein